MSFRDAFDTIIIIIIMMMMMMMMMMMITVIVHLFTVGKKVWLNLEAIKVSQKRGKIIYLYKSVNINFCLTFKILSKFQESSTEKFKQNLFGEYMFCVTLDPEFYFCLIFHKLDEILFIHFEKDSMSYFVV